MFLELYKYADAQVDKNMVFEKSYLTLTLVTLETNSPEHFVTL